MIGFPGAEVLRVKRVSYLNDPVLVVQGLTVYRGTHLAVQEVSFTVPAGTDTAIIGPNGAGKSTLIQAVLGILPRQAGQIAVLDHALSAKGYLPPAVRQQIAYLPQNFLFDRRIPITVSELVGLGWDRVGPQLPWVGGRARRQAVRAALTKVEAWHLRDQLVSSLSGGETKRVLLAYCMVRPRSLLILDEAPAGLDVRRGVGVLSVALSAQAGTGLGDFADFPRPGYGAPQLRSRPLHQPQAAVPGTSRPCPRSRAIVPRLRARSRSLSPYLLSPTP
jgi:zinc transport system ATP-binding protein